MDVLGLVQWALILIVSVLTLIYFYIYRHNDYWKKRGVPHDKPVPVFGNLGFLMRKSVWDHFKEMGAKYKDHYGTFLAYKPALVIQSPELARRVLVKDFEYFQERFLYSPGTTDPLGSLSLFLVKNPTWTLMRRELSPMFTSLRLKGVTELMNMNATYLVERIKREHIDKKEPVNLKNLFSMYTSDTVAYSVFGVRASQLNDQESPLWAITNHMVKFDFKRGLEFTLFFLVPGIADFFRLKFFSPVATEYIKKLFWGVVEERNRTGKSAYDKDLVKHLLKLKENLKLPEEMADNLMLAQAAIFILGSIETSSAILSYCLHELAHHPEEQEKLFREIDDALKQKNKDILEYDDLLEQKYLTACLIESMRKFPPVPYLDRLAAKTMQLSDEVTVEKGTPVLVNVVGLHYNPELYPEPERWWPERENAATSDNDNRNFSFLPFGDGPHFCIGKRYGMMQLRTALAQIIHKYKILPAENTPYEQSADPYAVILAPAGGGRVQFVQR